MKTVAANFILGLKENNCLTQVAVDAVVKGTRRLLNNAVNCFAKDLLENLQQQDEAEHFEYNFVSRIIRDTVSHYEDPFHGLDSFYFQKKYLEETVQVLNPREIILGERAVRKQSGNKCIVVAKNDCSYYIPIIDNIRKWLEHERIQSMLLSGTWCPADHIDGFLKDFCCGNVMRQHTILCNENAVPVILYYDEIDVCNPIGTRASVHKLGMFYFTLGTIDLKFRSRLPAMRLLLITSSKNVNRYGIDTILHPFYEDMVTLSQGVSFQRCEGDVILLKAALLAIVADTPASQLLGGFKEGVGGAYSKCRHCECTEDEMQLSFSENDFHARTLTTHLDHCNEIDTAATVYMKQHLKTTFGINRRSLFVNFPEFDVCTMLPQDIMHVMLEGVLQHEIKLALRHMVEEGILNLGAMNIRIRNFKYAYFDRKDKPCEIETTVLTSEDSRLKQTASKMMVLAKIFPFLLNGLVPSDNYLMEFANDLLKIYHVLLSPVISLATLSLLKLWIDDHLGKFKLLFSLGILPKQHYMIHFPRIVKQFGPPIRYSCMRFEAKHRYFKQLATKQNFLNLSKSLATRYQNDECLSQISDDCRNHPLLDSELIVGPSKAVSDVEYIKRQLVSFLGVDPNDYQGISAYTSRYVIVCGTKYVINHSYLLVEAVNHLPQFGILRNIYILNSSEVCFETEMFETLFFDETMKAYVVQQPDLAQGYHFVQQTGLLDHTCYDMVLMNSCMYIPIEYDLTDLIDLHELNMDKQG